MKQSSIEATLAHIEGYPAFMSPEHISLILKHEQEKILNGKDKKDETA